MKVFEPGARAASKSTDTVTGEMRDITWMETRSPMFQLECFTVFVQIKLEKILSDRKRDKRDTETLFAWMNVLCLCRSVLHIIAWHSYCSLHGHARFPTDFRYCLILLSSKRYSDSRFQPQRQQVSELNFTLYCFFQFLLLSFKAGTWLTSNWQ